MNKKYLIATCLTFLFASGLCLAADSKTDEVGFWSGSLLEMIGELQGQLLTVLGGICILMIIIGGGMYMTAKEDAGQAKNGLLTVKVALIGLALVMAAAMLYDFVADMA
ncbi:MAG: hypothetical protein MNSN_03140 [Minisyncoccus archaeiphilus]|uniref:hypothetical protein n=1 Tax=Minisyncoccus archaeiphilus TaxID=3238481 RepID=UPI002B08213A|nr:MAG: hypothetical protein MNSN_03140 [Candidatus Parcubacteria bacterium]